MTPKTQSPKRSTARIAAGLAIVAFWLVMMGLLLERELGGTRIAAEGAGIGSAEPTAVWLGVFFGDTRVGYVHLAQTPERRDEVDGIRFATSSRMTLSLMGRDTDLELTGVVWRPLSVPQAQIDASVRSMGHDFTFRGEVAGGELAGEVTSAGEVLPLRVPVGEDLLMQSGLGSALRFPALEVGDDVRFDSFDPLTLRRAPARVRCVGETTLEVAGETVAAKILEVETGGLESRAFIDDAGQVLQAETSFGLSLRKMAPAQALAPFTADDGEGLLSFSAVRPSGPRPFRGADFLRLRLTGLGETGSADGDREVELRAAQEPAAGRAEVDPSTLDPAYLGSDAFVQSDHPQIVARARAIVGQEEDPWARALAIHDWVFTALDKEPVVSIPSALEVLAQRRGDCNEHTVLFAALARATGLPTRIAIGLVWSDELDGFYYHAWPEVFVGGGWVAMDPTLDQPLADATHLKLIEGGIETWPRLLTYLGRMEIDVLEVR
ncbi:MAG: transglutaminase-like domain-containing protein [Acidobacteriota bacterium]